MGIAKHKLRLAVISPFLAKSHGTERIVIEWIAPLAGEFEIHIYSQSVDDIDLSSVTWHRIPRLPGPHLLNFLWWFTANHIWRFWDRCFHGLDYDVVYSPGINCLDADAISVHIVFCEFLRQVEPELKLARNPVKLWPTLLHRRLYYSLIVFLERRLYPDTNTILILYAKKTAADLNRFFSRWDRLVVMYLGLDHVTYNPARRAALRPHARTQLGLPDDRLALLLVGNDLHKKGIRALFDALVQLRALPIDLLVVGRENPAPFQAMAAERDLASRVRFLPARNDVEVYYAAADVYVGPSLEDTFALPPAESMACGLPVIVSSTNGTAEIITHNVDGLILDDGRDSVALAALIRRLVEDKNFRNALGDHAAKTARQYTWEANARQLAAIFADVLERKARSTKEEAGG